ncbi:MAG: hypothetical protein AAF483_09330 [Planctomycetota bacterium]
MKGKSMLGSSFQEMNTSVQVRAAMNRFGRSCSYVAHFISFVLLLTTSQGCRNRSTVDEARARQLADPQTRDLSIRKYAEQTYPPESQDLFAQMDQKANHGKLCGPLELEEEEIIGRNAWMIWTGGNEAFWDWLARHGYGTVDLLKVLDSNNRGVNWAKGGLVTEPGMRKPTDEETKAAYGIRFARPIQANYSKYEVNYGSKNSGYQLPNVTQQLNYSIMKPYGAKSSDLGGNGEEYEMPKSNAQGETEGPYSGMQPPDPYIYGYSSGIVGLRLFPNPDFHPSQGFDAERFYDPDDSYSSDPNTIRPFRVGMACSFCHVGPHPLSPPDNFEFPKWENLSGTIGAQYLRVRVALGGRVPKDNYFHHVLDSQMPGTIDTSLIASDGINNSNTMNAIFGLGWRVNRARFNPAEQLSEESEEFAGLWDESYGDYLGTQLGEDLLDARGRIGEPGGFEGNPRLVPRVLVDGSDSVGSWVALARVYMNIGLFHQRWVQNHNPVLGFRPQSPFKLADCEANSVYWHATKLRVDPMTAFFLKSSDPMKLRDAPDGLAIGWPRAEPKKNLEECKEDESNNASDSYQPEQSSSKIGSAPESTSEHENQPSTPAKAEPEFNGNPWDDRLAAGRRVFARGCIACHSSVQPGTNETLEKELDVEGIPAAWKDRLALDLTLEDLRELTRGHGELPELYQEWALNAVEEPEFWKENYLSTDRRIPVSMVRTNAGRATATNAMQGQIWEDFASWTYKDLQPVGEVPYFDPFSKSNKTFEPQGGGPGYYRVPTLISAWSTAPFFHNNALGDFNNDPSVAGRLDCYQDAMEKLLTPAQRATAGHDRGYAGRSEAESAAQTQLDAGLVWRTSEESYFLIRGSNVPSVLAGTLGVSFTVAQRVLPWIIPLLFLLLGLLFVFGDRIVHWLSRIKSKLPFQEAIVPLQILLGLLVSAAAAFAGYLAFSHRDYVRLLEIDRFPGFFQLQTYVVAALLLAFGIAVLWTYLHGFTWGRAVVRGTGLACLFFSAVTCLFTAPILAGNGSDIRIGPFPKSMPVNLVTNLDRNGSLKDFLQAFRATAEFLRNEKVHGTEEAIVVFERDVAPALLKISTCPDIVLDHGHDYEFIENLTEQEKTDLINLVKSF